MTKEDVFEKVKDFLEVNGRYESDADVENYIYRAAYNTLMVDMYGTDPISQIRKASSGGIKEVKPEEDKKIEFGKKVSITVK